MSGSLIVTMGISGSGKSRYSKEMESKGFIRVCMDDLRKLYTGSISDQTQNHRVADTAFAITEFLLLKEKDVIFDSTATNAGTRNKLLKMARDQGASTELVVFMDSKNFQLCQDRVNKELEGGVDRSNTTKEDSIMARQYSSFMDALKAIDKEGWNDITKIGD